MDWHQNGKSSQWDSTGSSPDLGLINIFIDNSGKGLETHWSRMHMTKQSGFKHIAV